MSKFFRFSILFLVLTVLLPASTCRAQVAGARSYTTITGVTVNALSNGVQVRIVADGILQFRNPDTSGSTMSISFPDARNGTGKNFFNVNSYPVSHIQLSTPQNAPSGIGLDMRINNFVATTATATSTPDGQGVLLIIQSNRTIERTRRPAAGATTGAAGTGAGAENSDEAVKTEVSFENGLLSLRAVRADIHALMAAIAQKAGVSIAVDDAVERKVSINLDGVETAAAIRSVATGYGLAVSLIGEIYMMSEGVPTDLATYHLSDTASFRMQNVQAATASGLLPNFLFSYVKVNPEQNAVVVTAPSQMLAKIGSDLKKLDVRPPQILIEAIAVELTDTTDRDIGFIIGNPDRTSFSSIDTPGGLITYNTIGRMSRNFEANLKALELTGKARVRARPQMAVLNGRTANIFIGAQRFILTQFISGGLLQTRIQPVDVGVKLQITPLTGGNDEITTRVTPEVSNITELDLQTGLPVLSSRRADTTVRVKDGETIVIGGLTLNQEQTADRKIPILGSLPLIGSLFRGKKQNLVRTELVVFVTPHILPASSANGQVGSGSTGSGGTGSGGTGSNIPNGTGMPNGTGTPIAPAAPKSP